LGELDGDVWLVRVVDLDAAVNIEEPPNVESNPAACLNKK